MFLCVSMFLQAGDGARPSDPRLAFLTDAVGQLEGPAAVGASFPALLGPLTQLGLLSTRQVSDTLIVALLFVALLPEPASLFRWPHGQGADSMSQQCGGVSFLALLGPLCSVTGQIGSVLMLAMLTLTLCSSVGGT